MGTPLPVQNPIKNKTKFFKFFFGTFLPHGNGKNDHYSN